MKESDQLATSFITPFGMFCYVTMPFGLRNAGATYQRCMQHVFGDHIGRTVEAYVDDIVVKTRKADDQVMKNASCHDDKMEAYCKAVRALEDKFYGIELNHVPRRYNEEADELAKIASGRITVPPNVFARDVAQPSVVLEPHPSSHAEPSGAPSNPAGAEPMDEDPSNEAYILSLLEGYGSYEADVMDIEPAPVKADWRDKYIAWMARGELPSDRAMARRIARMAKSFALVDGELYKRAASGILQRCVPIPRGVSSCGTSTLEFVAITPRLVPSLATPSARAFTGLPRLRTPARSYAPAKGASSTPASPTFPPMPCKPSL
jgi:hypothetical protein